MSDTVGRYANSIQRLRVMSVVMGVLIIGLASYVLLPYFRAVETPVEEAEFNVPAYDYQPWHSVVVQEGRAKPFETAAREAVRSITGKSKFSALPNVKPKDAVEIALMWIMTNGAGNGTAFPDWEALPFILCDHHELRKWIYAHKLTPANEPKLSGEDIDDVLLTKLENELTEEQKHGKFISPADLRDSPGFARLLNETSELREKYADKAQQFFSPVQRKAEEVATRLNTYDAISQNAQVGQKFRGRDLLRIVQLDRIPGSEWFSISEIKLMLENPDVWHNILVQRMKESPQFYLKPEQHVELKKFQDALVAGKGQDVIPELRKEHAKYIDDTIDGMLKRGLIQPNEVEEKRKRGIDVLGAKLGDLPARIKEAQSEGYNPLDPKYLMLHLDYLEARYPNLYVDAVVWQDFPKDRAIRVLNAYEGLQDAYKSGESEKFSTATKTFFDTMQAVSDESLIEGLAAQPSATIKEAYQQYQANGDKEAFFAKAEATGIDLHRYPGISTVPLELTFNKVQPFMWAWILMLPATAIFVMSYVSGSKTLYGTGWMFFLGSMLFQLYGFYCRVAISGRAPVSNMYETVIFVAFMSAVFAMILELVYRKGVIAIAGALVSTIALVLADQLPVALDPKISPLNPVLRSNFWLIIHVLTIVASYAGGTLAWGLANVSLALLLFGKPDRDTLKTLSTFTYRAMQIAVLLLAAGTFLGGWWAAYSWGRFWGWDPKETWALISLVCYIIPLHARYIGWVKDFGLAISAILCYAAILMCWYGVNFVLGAGLHSYGFGGGGPYWVLLAGMLNVQWVLVASMLYLRKLDNAAANTKPNSSMQAPATV